MCVCVRVSVCVRACVCSLLDAGPVVEQVHSALGGD